MKLLKKFHKLHTIDIIFICIAIILLGFFYLYFKREIVSIMIRVRVVEDSVAYGGTLANDQSATAFVVGDTEKDELGRTISEITRVDSYRMTPDQEAIYLDIKTQATYSPRKGTYTLRGEDISYGQILPFSFSKAQFRGVIVDVPGLQGALHIKNGTSLVKAQYTQDLIDPSYGEGVPEFVATALKQGDLITNSRGEVLAKILDVTITPAKRTVETAVGQVLIVDDPELKDVYYTIQLSTKRVNGNTYMFDYIPVSIGEKIPLYTSKITVWPTITEIL